MTLNISFDIIVIGVGSMGSAACYYLSKRGYKVLGLEHFDISHEYGSHAGQSRIIRKAYFEHSDYVPLLERAYKNWKTIEQETGEQVYYKTGLLYAGTPESEIIKGVEQSAALYDVFPDHGHGIAFTYAAVWKCFGIVLPAGARMAVDLYMDCAATRRDLFAFRDKYSRHIVLDLCFLIIHINDHVI